MNTPGDAELQLPAPDREHPGIVTVLTLAIGLPIALWVSFAALDVAIRIATGYWLVKP